MLAFVAGALAGGLGIAGEDCWGIVCECVCSARSGWVLVGAARRGGQRL